MIYEYEKGIHKTKLSTWELKNLILKIKKFHKFKINEKPYDLKKDLLNYNKNLDDFRSKKLIKESFRNLLLLKKFKQDLVLTHHDLNPKNILFKNNSIKIIDWEYAGLNDRFFDLASICVEFSLNKKDEKLILQSYFNQYKKKHLQKLNHFKIIYKNLCSLWFKYY